MKQFYTLLTIILVLSNGHKLNAQTEWTGPITTFTKIANADWTMPANQDLITINVKITRQNNQGIYNIAQESSYAQGGNISPVDTEWAFGTISDGVSTLTFTTWDTAHGGFSSGGPGSLVGQDMVLHLITDDIYINIKFLSWGMGGAGGGSFSYERSTDQFLSINETELDNSIKLFPNPSSEFIQFSGLNVTENYKIYTILGAEVKNGVISIQEKIDISNLPKGMYFLKFDNENTIKFLKE